MRNTALLIALFVWAVIVTIGGIFLTGVEYVSRNEAIGVAAVYVLFCIGVAGVISVIALKGFPSVTFARPRNSFTGWDGHSKFNSLQRRLRTKGVVVALVLSVAALSVFAYRMDQRLQELEGRSAPGGFTSDYSADYDRRIMELEGRVDRMPILPPSIGLR